MTWLGLMQRHFSRRVGAYEAYRHRLTLACAAIVILVSRPDAAISQGSQASPVAATLAAQRSGLPIPRFVSLKSDRVHLRQGPGFDHKVLWVFRRAGLPVEVIQEFESWRQVRDAEGTTGWLLQSLVSGRRTALILPWEAKAATPPRIELRDDDHESAQAIALLEAGVIAQVRSCDGQWCYVTVGQYSGYIEQKRLWGVYDGERIK